MGVRAFMIVIGTVPVNYFNIVCKRALNSRDHSRILDLYTPQDLFKQVLRRSILIIGMAKRSWCKIMKHRCDIAVSESPACSGSSIFANSELGTSTSLKMRSFYELGTASEARPVHE